MVYTYIFMPIYVGEIKPYNFISYNDWKSYKFIKYVKLFKWQGSSTEKKEETDNKF